MISRALLSVLIPAVLGWSSCARAEPARAQAEPTLRHATDLKEIARIQHMHPDAWELVEQVDAALAKGEWKRATELSAAAGRIAPHSALISRRQCQSLLWAGEHSAALNACQDAMRKSGTPMALRATVAVLMASPKPSSDHLAAALAYAQIATEKATDQPWGYAARCDIAYRLGEPAMLRKCKKDLQSVAPGHYETERVARWKVSTLSPAAIGAWLMAAFLLAFTLLHAVWQAVAPGGVRMGRRRRSPSASVALLLALPLLVSTARAQSGAGLEDRVLPPAEATPAEPSDEKVIAGGGLSKWPVDRENPVSSVPTPEQRDGNPLEYGYHIMDLADLASTAAKKGDHAAAAKFWEASVKAVPDVASGYRHACESHSLAANIEKALTFCRQALGVPGVTSDDYVRYTHLLTSQSAPLKKEQIEEIEEIIGHLKGQAGAEGPAALVLCELGARLEDRKRLEACTAVLGKLAPQDAKTISFQWALALMRGEIDRAQALIVEAKKTPMAPEGIRTMEKAVRAELAWPRRLRRHWPLVAGGLGAAALLAFAATRLTGLRRRDKISPAL